MYTYLPQRSRLKRIQARKRRQIVAIISIALLTGLAIGSWLGQNSVTFRWPVIVEPREIKLISPIPDETPTPTTAPHGAVLIKPVMAKEPEKEFITGEASYYSIDGCLGCSEDFTMANMERLDDSKRTLALTPEMVNSRKLLNDAVTIINLATGESTTARVTDTGGFGKYNRVADLSVATKEVINCPSLCQVKIIFD